MPDTSTYLRGEGAAQAPIFYQGPVDVVGDVKLNRKWFTQRTEAGLVAGSLLSVAFAVDRPAHDVWPVVKDFNLWQNSYNYYYSGVVGDLDEGETFSLSLEPNGPGVSHYEIVKVIPEHLIVTTQPAPTDPLVGLGVVRGGFHVFMLTEYENKTLVTVVMQHASLMAASDQAMREEEAVDTWRNLEHSADGVMKWRDIFIPNLKRLVSQGD